MTQLDPSAAARKVKTAEDALALVERSDARHVKVAVTDMDGILRGKYISREKFASAIQKGFGFCDVVLGWDSNDQLYDNGSLTGWHTGYPDAEVRLLPETCRALPFEGDTLLFLGEFAGRAENVCPRATLRRAIQRAFDLGLLASAGFEYEFFVFDETPQSASDKGYQDLRPFTPGNFGYSMLRNSVYAELYDDILKMAEHMDFPIEGLHTETGPGVLEAAIGVDEALAAADKANLFRTFMKVLAQRNGLMATFMAKWSNQYPGQSGHIHVSLRSLDGEPAFYDDKRPHAMSETMRHFVGGQQALMPELLAMVAPTVNAYTRLVPGFWAPTHASWGIENRTCALRVIPGSAKAQRVEFRVAASDANPYLALAAALGAGLYGIEHKIEPDAAIEGNAYAATLPAERALPATLMEAATRLKASDAARSLFGDAFVEHFVASREWEAREFRKHVTDWELKRYFEII